MHTAATTGCNGATRRATVISMKERRTAAAMMVHLSEWEGVRSERDRPL